MMAALRVWAGRLVRPAFGAWAVVTASFLCLHVLPGDPARIALGPQASRSTVEQFRRAHGLDRPVAEQYLGYVAGLARLNLGVSSSRQRAVGALIVERIGATLLLTAAALSVAILLGLLPPLLFAVGDAALPGRAVSATIQAIAFIPPYLLALATLILAALVTPSTPVLFDPYRADTWILASLALAIYPTALLFQVFTQALERQTSLDYALRAAACGFDRGSVVLREALPNAINAPLGALANATAYFFTSAFFVEAVFGIPGLGRLAQDAVRLNDLPLLNGVCLTYCVVVGLFGTLLEGLAQTLRRGTGPDL